MDGANVYILSSFLQCSSPGRKIKGCFLEKPNGKDSGLKDIRNYEVLAEKEDELKVCRVNGIPLDPYVVPRTVAGRSRTPQEKRLNIHIWRPPSHLPVATCPTNSLLLLLSYLTSPCFSLLPIKAKIISISER